MMIVTMIAAAVRAALAVTAAVAVTLAVTMIQLKVYVHKLNGMYVIHIFDGFHRVLSNTHSQAIELQLLHPLF